VRARQLTWQLLTFSRGGVPVKKTLAIPDILKESVNLALRGSNVRCMFDIAPDLWDVSADEGQLVQVFSNVVINAQQAMPQGGAIDIRAENIFEPATRREQALSVQAGGYVRVSITDVGIGIPPENLSRIFDPYFTTKQKGSGLGLATLHSIIKNHGGYVSVESSLGQGTTIRISFPAAIGRAAHREFVASTPTGRGRILVMDDEASIRTLASRMITSLGHEAEVVDDGTAAIEQYMQALKTGQPFDAVILDLVVPGGMGAREAIARLSTVDPAVKAIVVSGYAQDSAVTEFREHGFKASIAKPYTLEELDATLHAVMAAGTWPVH
jgi:two-component system cell cycle sensor histidine kinase/response regulator CckA